MLRRVLLALLIAVALCSQLSMAVTCKGDEHPCAEVATDLRIFADGVVTKQSSGDEGIADQQLVSHEIVNSKQMAMRIQRRELSTKPARVLVGATEQHVAMGETVEETKGVAAGMKAERAAVDKTMRARQKGHNTINIATIKALTAINSAGVDQLKEMRGRGGGGGGDATFLAMSSKIRSAHQAAMEALAQTGDDVTEMDRGAETSVWKSEGEARVELLKAEDDITASMTSKVHEADTDLHTRTVAAETNFDSKYDEIATRFDARDSAASRQQAKHSQELTHAINGAVIRLQQAIWRANLDTVHRETAANAIASQSVNAALQSARRVTRASHAASDRVRLAEASVAVRLA